MSKFEKQLKFFYNLNPSIYLDYAKLIAKKKGYDPNKLTLATDDKHKLNYDGVLFGAVGYKDKLIYSWLEYHNIIPKGTTLTKSTNYRKRAEKVMMRSNNKFSASSLSFNIIW